MTNEEWERRELEKLYVCIFMMEEEVYIKREGKVEKQKVYILFGINLRGYKDFIKICVPKENTTSYWISELMTLKGKGIEDIVAVSIPDNKHIEKGFKFNYKDVIISPSLLEIYNKSKNYISRREHRILMQEILKIYRSENIEEAKELYKELIENIKYNKIMLMILEKYKEKIYNMYKYGKRIREVTSNTDSYNKMRNRINIKMKTTEVFKNEMEIRNYVNEIVREEEKIWKPSKKEWEKIINEMDTKILERISELV